MLTVTAKTSGFNRFPLQALQGFSRINLSMSRLIKSLRFRDVVFQCWVLHLHRLFERFCQGLG